VISSVVGLIDGPAIDSVASGAVVVHARFATRYAIATSVMHSSPETNHRRFIAKFLVQLSDGLRPLPGRRDTNSRCISSVETATLLR
jgi:hypothetical protein